MSGAAGVIPWALKSGLGIYGGFNGTETNLNQRNWQTNVTLLTASNIVLFNNDGSQQPIDNSAVLGYAQRSLRRA